MGIGIIFDGGSIGLNDIAPFGREVVAPELNFRLLVPNFFRFLGISWKPWIFLNNSDALHAVSL